MATRWEDLAPAAPAPSWDTLTAAPPNRAAPSGGTAPEDPREDGPGGILGVLKRADEFSGRNINRIAGGLGRFGANVSQSLGLPDAVTGFFQNEAQIGERNAAVPVAGATSWEDVKANPSFGTIAPYVFEQGLGGTPDMANAVLNPLSYVASRTGEIAHNRAVNSGRQDPGLLDMLVSAPVAVGSMALERLPIGSFVRPAGNIATGALRSAGMEGVTEAAQNALEYAGTTLGTNVPFSWSEAGDQALQGAVVGGPFGASVHTSVQAVRPLRNYWLQRGVDTSHMSDDQLVEGSLDGTVHPGVGPVDVEGVLKSAGASPEQFSTPDIAARMADRVQQARGTPSWDELRPAYDPETVDIGDAPLRTPEPAPEPEPVAAAPEPKGFRGAFNKMVGITLGSESGGRRFGSDGKILTSPKGARGEMQVMPATAADPGHGIKPSDGTPADDARVGRELLGKLVDKYGDPAKAWGAYNWGEGRVDRAVAQHGTNWLESAPDETRAYVEKNVKALGSRAQYVYRAPDGSERSIEGVGEFENTEAPQSLTHAELSEKGARGPDMATGTGDLAPFPAVTDDPEGQPGFHEERARSAQKPIEAPQSASAPSGPSDTQRVGKVPEATAEPAVEAFTPKPLTREPVSGSDESVVTPRGREVDTRFKVYEADDLISSDRDGYLSDLQPRDRASRASSDAQVAEIASRLDPEQLHSSRLAAQGAPIVGSDRMVESGNGRTMSIRRMYDLHPERAADYRKMIEGRGLSTEGFERPVLVRERTADLSPEDRLAFVREANERDTMTMSATEQAKSDAGTLSDDTIGKYRGGAVNAAGNRDFVRSFVDEVVNPADRNAMLTPDGGLSSTGIQRIRSAMLSKAFGNPDLIGRIVEDPDTNIKAIGNTLTDAAGGFARLRGRVKAGAIPERFDITKQVGEMAHMISRSRTEGIPVSDLINQRDAFSGETDPATEALVRMMFKPDAKGNDLAKPRSAADIADGLRHYLEEADKVQDGPGLFGEEVQAVQPQDILHQARERLEAKDAAKKSLGRKLWEDDNGSLDPEAFKKLFAGIVDVDGLAHDAERLRDTIGDPKEALEAFAQPMRRMVSAAFFTNDARVRALAARFKSSALTEYANLWHARAGAGDATTETYHEAVTREATTRSQRMFEVVHEYLDKPASMQRIRDLLATPHKTLRATAAERAAATKLRDLLKDTIEYRKGAGEDIGEVSDGYFPRILDVDYVAHHRDGFIRNATTLYEKQGMSKPDAERAAGQWLGHVLDTYAGLDGGTMFAPSGSGLGSRTAKSREFGKDADQLLRDFYNKDVFHTLAAYFSGAAKRAEFARRFGRDGAQDSSERKAWIDKHGPEKTKFDVLMDRVKEDVRASTKDPAGVLHVVEDVHRSNLGQMASTNPTVRTITSYLHAWNQLAKMDRTTITSLGELTMGFIRGGPRYGFSYMKDSLNEFVRQVRGADPSDAARWAEVVGVANDAMVNQALMSRISAENSTAGTQKVLASYYKAIGLHQFTEGTRVSAVKMGRKLIDIWAHDMTSSRARVRKRAELYLKELGVKDPAAFSARVRTKPFSPDEVLTGKGDGGVYGTALLRFTNQTVMMPSRAEKPTWANHPAGSLVFSLMGYSYAFKKNVLDRTARLGKLGVAERDPALLIPAFSLSILAAFQALNDTYLRPFLFGSNYDFKNETPTEFMMRVADRAGFTAGASPFINAVKAVRYDRDLTQSLSGPVIGSLADATQKIFVEPFTDKNSKNTNTAERNAAAALYDTVVEPGIDAIAAARLKGVVKSAAILGTGNRKGGVLPGDKDAFIDAAAGRKAK